MRFSPPVASLLCAVAAAPIGMTAAAADGVAPNRILLCGDSMLKAVVRSITREFAATPSITIDPLISIGTGLARPDVFDWPAELRKALTARPDGRVIQTRASDGTHFNADGADILARAIRERRVGR